MGEMELNEPGRQKFLAVEEAYKVIILTALQA